MARRPAAATGGTNTLFSPNARIQTPQSSGCFPLRRGLVERCTTGNTSGVIAATVLMSGAELLLRATDLASIAWPYSVSDSTCEYPATDDWLISLI